MLVIHTYYIYVYIHIYMCVCVCGGCSCGAKRCGADADCNDSFLCATPTLSQGEEPKLVDFARGGTAHV